MNKYLALFGIVLLVSFALWSKYVDRKAIIDLDFATTVKIQEKIDTSSRLRIASLAGEVMEGATYFASPELSVIAVLVLTCIAFIKAKGKKKLMTFIIPFAFVLLVLGEMY